MICSTIRVFLRAKEGRGHAVDRIVNIIVFESHGRRNINIGNVFVSIQLRRNSESGKSGRSASAAYVVYGSRLQLRNSGVEWKNEITGYGTKAWRVVRKH